MCLFDINFIVFISSFNLTPNEYLKRLRDFPQDSIARTDDIESFLSYWPTTYDILRIIFKYLYTMIFCFYIYVGKRFWRIYTTKLLSNLNQPMIQCSHIPCVRKIYFLKVESSKKNDLVWPNYSFFTICHYSIKKLIL